MSQPAAIVTGGASGIGAASARMLAANGYAVVVTDVAPEGEETAGDLQAGGHEARFVRADVSVSEEVAAVVDSCRVEFGRVDAMVNCAGIDGAGQSLCDVTDDDLDRVLAVNLKGTLYGMQHAARAMSSNGGGGAIVNIASTAAVVGLARLSAYSASKGAVVSITRSAAVELGRSGIRVNAICPGSVRTGMIDKSTIFDAEALERSVRRYPIPRIADPSEIAHAVHFLCSPASSFITGAVFMVDGGMTAV